MTHLCGVLVLPALSVKSPRLLAELQRDEISLKELSELLKLDPGLGARLLHVANSPFFGVSGKIASVGEAVIVLGLNQTKGLIQLEIIRSVMAAHPWNLVSLEQFWHRSLSIAAACQALASHISYSQAAAFTTGVFHNLGVLALLQQYGADYSALVNEGSVGQGLADLEMAHFHTDHGQMGAEVLSSWNFPPDICQAIAEQYRRQTEGLQNLGLLILQAAHLLSNAELINDSVLDGLPHDCLQTLRLTEESIPMLREKIGAISTRWLRLARGG